MPRTTVDIDAPILRELKRVQKREGRSLGRLVSDLLAQALGARKAEAPQLQSFRWISARMAARIDLSDKDAVYTALDRADAGPGDSQS